MVILDPEAYGLKKNESPRVGSTFGCYCSACNSPMSVDDILVYPRYLLLAPTAVEGFDLETRKWTSFAPLELHAVQEHEWDTEALDSIQLDEAVKEKVKRDHTRYFDLRRKLISKQHVDRRLEGLRLVLHGEYLTQLYELPTQPP